MTFALDRIDSAPIVSQDFDPQFLQWLWVLIDTLNEIIGDLEGAINFLTAPNLALLQETVTLTSGINTFTVADGSIYRVGYQVIGTGIPNGSNITSIVTNTITISNNASASGAENLVFIPVQGDIGNGILLYDTNTNVYVGMQNSALVQFTTSAYP